MADYRDSVQAYSYSFCMRLFSGDVGLCICYKYCLMGECIVFGLLYIFVSIFISICYY